MKKNKNEYKDLLLEYSFPTYAAFSTEIPEAERGSQKMAEIFLEKYWLPYGEYHAIWKPLQDLMFVNQQEGLPELKFATKYEMIALRGGIVFEESDFKKLQKCMQHVGDKHFVVIENTFGDPNKSQLQMKFPIDITWHELMSGSFISIALFELFQNEYFVFGESGAWGKYAANDYEMPLRIVGFESKYSALFREAFKESEEEEREILTRWVPKGYLD